MKKAFVVGHPIAHSRSPKIHGYWLGQHGIEGAYERIDVAPADFPDFLKSFAAQGYIGGNVTIPHKEAAFAHVPNLTDRARKLGAVNTLWIENGFLHGDNTDVIGFMANLDQALGPDWERDINAALIIGAGGAARAVVAGLQERPIERIFIANRTLEKAEEVASALSAYADTELIPLPFETIAHVLGEVELLVNTTSLGMKAQPPLAIDLSPMPDRSVVADIVYVPLKTPLLEAAEARALRIVDGLGMLLHQAVPGFARWFGGTPQVTPELYALVAADIEGKT